MTDSRPPSPALMKIYADMVEGDRHRKSLPWVKPARVKPARQTTVRPERFVAPTTYPQRVRDNILPLSTAQTLPKAFEEWSATNQVIDHEKPTEVCQLCDQEALRYHFLIRNALTKRELWVGSQCILSFGISVFDELRRKLSPRDAKKRLARLLQAKRLEVCLSSLERLAAAESHDILRRALKDYRSHKRLTPKQASVVFWRLGEHQIDYSPSFFKIRMNKYHKLDLKLMDIWNVHRIWPALSPSQRQLALGYGHSAPPPILNLNL